MRCAAVGFRIATAALLMAGCGTPPDARGGAAARDDEAAEARTTAAALDGTEWTVVQLRGAPPLPLPPLTLRFDADSYGGYGGCNRFGGPYQIAADTFRTAEVESTLMACPDPIGSQELALHAALKDARRVRMAGDTLRLLGDDGTAVIVAARRRLAQMDPARLHGRWRLVEVGGVSPPAVPGVYLAFIGGSELRGFAGCRIFTGAYVARGHRLSVTTIAMTGTECLREDLLRFEGGFTTELSGTTDYQIAGDTLILHTLSGRPIRLLRAR
ncbi:MAG TPA: META domain-containing protein [Longimicrobium sp.]|jgi:heat shock protein HslJ|uniref:META domain-containing protein n=1 Tax=Longimicrobium sp. TaxID=2029185 RepID=UPI002EDA5E21